MHTEWSEIPWGLIAPLLVVQLLLVTVALVSLVRTAETRGPKWMWVIIIFFVSMIGPVLYFVIGRKEA